MIQTTIVKWAMSRVSNDFKAEKGRLDMMNATTREMSETANSQVRFDEGGVSTKSRRGSLLAAFASVWLIHVLLAAPTPGEATANGYPAWQGLSDANHVAGRIISPSDLRQRVAIVVEIDSAKAYDHLLIAAELAVHFNQVTLPNSGSWDFFEQHPNSIVLVVNRGARLTSAKFDEVAQSKNKDDNLKFMQMKSNLVPVYNDVSFAGAPDAAGKYPFYYVMGPSGVEPIDQGPAVRGFNRTLKPKIQKAIEEMSAGGQVWKPYYGFSSDSDLTAELKGLLAKGKPLKAFEQKLQKKIKSPNVEISKGSQLLYDGLMQTKGELLLRIRMESLQCPHRAVYDRQTLLKYWPTAKKDIYPKIDNFSSEAMVMAKMLEKIMLWRSPDFKCKNASEAKKIVAELTKMKKSIEGLKESKDIAIQNGAMLLEVEVDGLIERIPASVG